jgi:hypothetical protein
MGSINNFIDFRKFREVLELLPLTRSMCFTGCLTVSCGASYLLLLIYETAFSVSLTTTRPLSSSKSCLHKPVVFHLTQAEIKTSSVPQKQTTLSHVHDVTNSQLKSILKPRLNILRVI